MNENSVEEAKNPNPRKDASFFSIITFLFTIPTFIQGFKKNFSSEDIYETLPYHKSEILEALAQKQWSIELATAEKNGKEPSLIKVLIRMFWKQYICLFIIIATRELVVQLCLPIALGEMISVYSNNTTSSSLYVYASCLIISCFLVIILLHSYYIESVSVNLKMQIACSTLLYQKILKLNKSTLGHTSGQIINLLSNDVNVFDNFLSSFSYIFIAPLQAAAILYITYKEIGVPAVFGMCLTVLVLPLQIFFGKLVSKYHQKASSRRDERLRLMTEMLHGIEIIKMYAWEKPFEKLISWYRKQEINAIRISAYSKGSFNFSTIYLSTSLFIMIITSVFFDVNMTAKNAFTVTVSFTIFSNTFMIFLPNAIANTQQVKVCLKRIKTFLLSHEVELRNVGNTKEYAVSVVDATVKLHGSTNDNIFTNLSVNFHFGNLTAIIGPVGCGKSSLLQVILQELPLSKGQLGVTGTLSYASQEPWIFSGSVQENILFGSKMNKTRYNDVIKCCALEKDLKLFSYGDKTVVGEKGALLSGGQKARINLARAIYRDADIYLLDDPLSAVDTHVGKQIFKECIRTFLKNKTVILVSHQLQYLKYVNHIVVLENRCLKIEGSPSDLEETGFDFAKYLKHDDENKNVVKENEENVYDVRKYADQKTKEEDMALTSKPMVLSTFGKYIQAANCSWLAILTLLCFIGTQVFTSWSFYYIAYWVRVEREQPLSSNDDERNDNMYIYSSIILGAFLLAILRVITYVNLSMKASLGLHNSTFDSLIRAPLRFFYLNSSGRILNRFSKDLSAIDEFLPSTAMNAFRIALNAAGTLVVICLTSYWFILPTICVLVVSFWVRKVYLATNLNILRVESISRSPIYNHANTSLQGLTTIRVFDVQDNLSQKFNRLLDKRTSVFFLSNCMSRALTFWTDCICFLYAVVVVIYFTLNTESTGENIGLAISQIIQLLGQLPKGIDNLTGVENVMVSVERILEYSAIEPETQLNKFTLKPSKSWPECGKITFDNVSLRYSTKDSYILKNLNFTIEPKEKIGIVGRTGAGKSSTITSLFQLTKTEGNIIIDDINIQTIDLHDLRRKISIIPQDPVLFYGSVRYNLDPFDEYDDEVIWNALEEVKLKHVVDKMSNGLNSKISQNGSNLSVGQRQLICLARAIIRKNKVLILDEATANVDLQTDDLIQETIKRKFSNSTVLTVAHRLKTVMDSDKVLVMDAGRIVEYDHAYNLLQNHNSMFYGMVQETEKTMTDVLESIAKESYSRIYHH